MSNQKHYDIGVSYANEDADIVEKIVIAMKKLGLTVFFDKDEFANLVGRNLIYTLPNIYIECCDYCLMFVSQAYSKKKWTGYEREWLFDKRIDKMKDDIYTDRIIPVFIDNTKLVGLNPGIIGFNVQRQTPEEIASVMFEKIYGGEIEQKNTFMTIEDIFFTLHTEIDNLLTQKILDRYFINKKTDFDIIFHIEMNNYTYFIRLQLDNMAPMSVIKIFHGYQDFFSSERIWDAEVYLENNKLYLINYNFSEDTPSIAKQYTIQELLTKFAFKIDCFIREHSYV